VCMSLCVYRLPVCSPFSEKSTDEVQSVCSPVPRMYMRVPDSCSNCRACYITKDFSLILLYKFCSWCWFDFKCSRKWEKFYRFIFQGKWGNTDLRGTTWGILPHSALSWHFSLAENLKSLNLQDGATKWHYYWSHPPPAHHIASATANRPTGAKLLTLFLSASIHHTLLRTFTEANGTKMKSKEDCFKWRAPQNIKRWISQIPPITSFSNFKLELRWQN
jgi:hypothetical protein